MKLLVSFSEGLNLSVEKVVELYEIGYIAMLDHMTECRFKSPVIA
jgi:hypothetical protein